MRVLLGLRGRRLALASAAIFTVAAGIAYASIPDAGTGVYHACMQKNGTIQIIDPATDRCGKNETEITFNQKGEQGLQGIQGVQGPPGADGSNGSNGSNGTNGVSPTVTQLAAGNANCPAGGAAITDAAGSTAYVCSGQNGADGDPFSGTFTSPNGLYSIAVTDTGVTVAGPNASIGVSATGVRVATQGSSSVTVTSDTSLTLRSGFTATLDSTGPLVIKGSSVSVNGPSCQPAARLGDSIQGSAPPPAGVVTGSISSGSPTVCIG